MELPQDFIERIRHQLGDSCSDFLACYDKERVYGLRYNPLKIGKEALRRLLLDDRIALEQVPWAEEGFYYPADTHPGRLPLHEAGAFYIQEPSAMAVVELLGPKPGEVILDLCAAPGGKSTQIAGRMQGEGLLISNEVVPQRAKTLSRNIERMGVRNAVVLNETPKRLAERFLLYFDRILVDAPCSGEGMFRKDPDARGEWSLQQVQTCTARQQEILSQAAAMLKPGGVLVYSTCTFAPQENEQMAEWFVQEYPQFTLEKSVQLWPHLVQGEGHYAARFHRQGLLVGTQAEQSLDRQICIRNRSGQNGMMLSRSGRSSRKKAGTRFLQERRSCGAVSAEFQAFCKETLSEPMQEWLAGQMEAGRIEQFGEQLCLLPPGIQSLDGWKTERAGLALGCLKKRRFEPSHALAMALGADDVTQTLELEEPERYLRGETVCCGQQKGYTLVTVHGCSVGWGKASQGVLKNHYPKGLRKF